MDLTNAQEEALKEVDRGTFVGKDMRNNHVHDQHGNKRIDRRTLNILKDEGLVEWRFNWGHNDNILQLTDKGKELLKVL